MIAELTVSHQAGHGKPNAQRIRNTHTSVTGSPQTTVPGHEWAISHIGGKDFTGHSSHVPSKAYAISGAAEPTVRAMPSNQCGFQSFSGRTAAACEGKVSGTA